MLKRGISYLLIILIVMGLSAGLIIGREEEITLDPKEWIGKKQTEIDSSLKKYIKKQQIFLTVAEEGRVTDIFIKTPELAVDSISLGDDVHKVLQTYPEEWTTVFPNYILVLKGREYSFGVASEYIIYLVEDKKVKEIQLGCTTDFLIDTLPQSNKEAETLLQGSWISEHNKTITFKQGILEDNLLRNLYDYQTYRVLSPNKLLISRAKGEKIEKVNLRFFVEKNTLYLFDINQLGIPIIETIEKFRLR